MTRVAIVPEPAAGGRIAYRAIAGEKQCVGRTPGAALDSLASLLGPETTATLVLVVDLRADEFFGDADRMRLEELIARWRSARDSGERPSSADQKELDRLVEAEVRASGRRAEAVQNSLRQ